MDHCSWCNGPIIPGTPHIQFVHPHTGCRLRFHNDRDPGGQNCYHDFLVAWLRRRKETIDAT